MENEIQPCSLQSICHVKASELFPKHNLEKEDKHLQVPYKTICGESVELLGRTADGVLALSNYRVCLQVKDTFYNIPLGLIEIVEVREIFYLYIGCKDARSLRLTFATNEHCQEWFRRITKCISPPKEIDVLFAFAYHAWASEDGGEEVMSRLQSKDHEHYYFKNEVERLRFDVNGAWRISTVNSDYKLCSTYPKLLLVPACITDDTLEHVARFRSAGRVPAVVWRHTGNGAVIARCSQPEVGWFSWRSSYDEDLISAIADACAFDRGHSSIEDGDSPVNRETPHVQGKKVLIMDARSYTTAVANRARGGGCECPEYYPRCEIQFMCLANIHSIRKSFHCVRQLCSLPEAPNWLSMLEKSLWLQNMSGLLRAAVGVAAAVEREARPVLVHCSDGWDRTPQIVALAQLLLDPYYRTIDGFQVLVEREWLDFGHKFGDRCGNTANNEDMNERCPVFLQWLDCVHQILIQFPCSFQYSQDFLVKLAQHTYSNLFGTFLCNSTQERLRERVPERTFSVWKFLRAPNFRNHLYSDVSQVLWPSCNVRDLQLWTEVYIGGMETSVTKLPTPIPEESIVKPPAACPVLTKTRSYDDLVAASGADSQQQRRSSLTDIKFESIPATDPETNTVYMNGCTDSLKHEEEEQEQAEHLLEANNTLTELPEETPPQINTNGCVVKRRKNRTISEELYDHFIDTDHEVNICDSLEKLNIPGENNNEESVVSSTDTLVNVDMVNGNKTCECTPVAYTNGCENGSNSSASHCGGDTCRVCSSTKREESGNSSTSGSRYSTPPLYSRTPSTGYPAPPLLDIDGLQCVQNDVQTRLSQIITEHRTKEQALERELHTTRLALIQQVCHHCSHQEEMISRPESICSEPHPGSLPSDLSWEAVEERDAQPTLWVPDHAVTRCQGCDTEFWLGRRKHHCRNCGKIFCADCSDNTAALPGEQLYEPVRVCNHCHCLLAPITNGYNLETCKKASAASSDNGKMTSSNTATT